MCFLHRLDNDAESQTTDIAQPLFAQALRRIARLGDGFYVNWKSIDDYRQFLDQLGANLPQGEKRAKGLYQQMGATDIDLVRTSKDQIQAWIDEDERAGREYLARKTASAQ